MKPIEIKVLAIGIIFIMAVCVTCFFSISNNARADTGLQCFCKNVQEHMQFCQCSGAVHCMTWGQNVSCVK